MIQNIILSGINVLAAHDKQLNEEQKRQVKEAVQGKDEVAEVGKFLLSVSDHIDLVVDALPGIEKCLKEDDSGEKLTQYVMDVAKNFFQSDISMGRVMVVVMMGYGIIRKFIKLFNVDLAIVNFTLKMAKLIYDVFEKFGVIRWINAIGGWGAAAVQLSSTKLNEICAGLIGQ